MISLGAPQRSELAQVAPTGSRPGELAEHANANTKGAYTQLLAASAFDAGGFVFNVFPVGGVACDFLFDFAIGAATSEQDILSNVPASSTTSISYLDRLLAELRIPAGSRLSARKQSTTAAQNLHVSANLLAEDALPWGSFQRATTYGAVTADSGGTSVDPGASAGSEGGWVELSAATTAPIKRLKLRMTNGLNDVRTTADWLIDIAIGAATSEQILVSDIHIFASSGNDYPMGGNIELPLSIPEGSRLAVRAQCSINDATDRLLDAVAIGIG